MSVVFNFQTRVNWREIRKQPSWEKNNKKCKKEVSITFLANGITAGKAFFISLCSWVFPAEWSATMRLKENCGKLISTILKWRIIYVTEYLEKQKKSEGLREQGAAERALWSYHDASRRRNENLNLCNGLTTFELWCVECDIVDDKRKW